MPYIFDNDNNKNYSTDCILESVLAKFNTTTSSSSSSSSYNVNNGSGVLNTRFILNNLVNNSVLDNRSKAHR